MVARIYHICEAFATATYRTLKTRYCGRNNKLKEDFISLRTYEKYEALLKERGLTNYQVAKDTGIAESVLSSWKSGRSEIKLDKIITIANYMKVPITFFIPPITEEDDDGSY